MDLRCGLLHKHNKESQSTPSATPNTTIRSFVSKQVLLHDWWLTKADSDCHGKQLGVGGFTSKERQGIRSFSSAPIVTRHDSVTLKTADGITVLVQGYLNTYRTLENGFCHDVCQHFQIGFPYYWEEFATVFDGEEKDHGTAMLTRNLFDDIMQKHDDDDDGVSGANRDKSPATPTTVSHKKMKSEQKSRSHSEVKDLGSYGPLTRSRARLLQTRTSEKVSS